MGGHHWQFFHCNKSIIDAIVVIAVIYVIVVDIVISIMIIYVLESGGVRRRVCVAVVPDE